MIPAFNEEAGIENTVLSACRALDKMAVRYEVIVVDDGSSDGTAASMARMAARNPAVRLLRQPANMGYGKALRDGFGASRYGLLFFTDADGQFDLDELGAFFPLADGNDIVCGYRKHKEYVFPRNLASFCYNLLVRLFLRPGVRDVNCAFKLMKREAVEALGLRSTGFFINAELLAKARRAGLKVVETPVSHFPRTAGVSKVRRANVLGTIGEMAAFMTGGLR